MKPIMRVLMTAVVAMALIVTNANQLVYAEVDGYICEHGRHTNNDKVLKGGVGDYGKKPLYYWYESGFTNGYKKLIAQAADSWTNTAGDLKYDTPICFRKTSKEDDAAVRVREKNLFTGHFGYTAYYTKKDIPARKDPSFTYLIENFKYAEIRLDCKKARDYVKNDKNGNIKKQAIIAHEMGHSMGLTHQKNHCDSIMHQAHGRTATRASVADLKIINHLYKK